jgi:hypothetical protein
MMRVDKAAEPADFDAKVRCPGLRACAHLAGKAPDEARCPRPKGERKRKQLDVEHEGPDGVTTTVLVVDESQIPSDDLPTFWREALDDLASAYNEICAYTCFRIHPVTGARTVDHWVPKSRDWRKAYDWDNFRFCAAIFNSKKGTNPDLVDPFDVQDGWFQLDPMSGKLTPNPKLEDPALRARIQDTIDELGLNDIKEERRKRVEQYTSGLITRFTLEFEAPHIARELARLGLL